jgi:hypothetical protein
MGLVVDVTPRPLYTWKWPSTQCIRGRGGPRAGKFGCGISHPHGDSILEKYMHVDMKHFDNFCADCTSPVAVGLTIIPIKIFLRFRLRIHKRFINSAFKYAKAAGFQALNVLLLSLVLPSHGMCSGAVVWGTTLQTGSSRCRFPTWTLGFFIDVILPAELWPWGRLSF